jgi:hypothetical protein
MKLLLLLCLVITSTYAATYRIKLSSPFAQQIRAQLKERQLDFDHGSGNIINVFTSNPAVKVTGLPHTIVAVEKGQPFYAKRSKRKNTSSAGISDYFDYAETTKFLRDLEANNSNFAKVYDLNELYNLPKSSDGNSTLALQISKTPGVFANKAKILIIGQHHARELMTHHAVMDIAKKLLADLASKDATALSSLENTSIWFVPVVNPDGLNYVFTRDNMWRKNRRNNSDGTYGVDLNRNYGFEWGSCGSNSSSTSSNIYKGLTPHSEVESLVMDKLNESLKAQYVISFHSSGNEVLFPYVCHQDKVITDQEVYFDLKDRLAKHLGFGKRYASSSGEDFEHHFAKHGSLSFLLEIGTSFQPSFSTYERSVKPKIQKIIPFLMNELKSNFIEIRVTDIETGAALKGVKVEIRETPLLQGEVRVTDQFGMLRRKFTGKKASISLSKAGRAIKIIELNLNQNGNTQTNVAL